MGSVIVHDLSGNAALGKIELNAAKKKEVANKKAADRAARDAERVKQHEKFVEQVYDLARQRSGRR